MPEQRQLQYGGPKIDEDEQRQVALELLEKLRRCLRLAALPGTSPSNVPCRGLTRSRIRHLLIAEPDAPSHSRARCQPQPSDDASEVAMAAEQLYKMTSFSSAVAIDRPEAMTDYDRAVFGAGAGAAVPPSGAGGPTAPAPHAGGTAEVPGPAFTPGEAHLDGHRYLMGDGFMLNEEEGPNGSVRTRRVAVMHSRSCLDNRAIIGKLPGVFEALVKAIRCVCRAGFCR